MVWQTEDKSDYEYFLKNHRRILVVFILLFVCLSLRLFYLQIIKGYSYRKISDLQRLHNTYERAPRGAIYSADNTMLVGNQFVYVALFYPSYPGRTPSNRTIEKLSVILGRNIRPGIRKSHTSRESIELASDLTIEEMFKIQENRLSLNGVVVIKEPKRECYYPLALSHVIGYTSEIKPGEIETLASDGYKRGDYIGRGGIEQSYDKYLRGKDGGWQVEVNARGHRNAKEFKYVRPKVGANVYSTIDLKLQRAAYNALQNSDTGRGAVVVLDTKTGAVRVLVSSPGFDINTSGTREFGKYLRDKKLSLFNRALQALYPPGSIFKVVTFAAAVEILHIEPNSKVNCTGRFELGDRYYSCWYKKGHGMIGLIPAMVQSCNVYFYKLGLKLGVSNLEKYAKKFHLGEKTGIDLPNEKDGFIPSPLWKKAKMKIPWLHGDTVILAIGQGALWVTPLQMAYMTSAVANRGRVYPKPYVVDRIEDSNGVLYVHKSEFDGPIELSDRTWNLLHMALWEAIESGTGKKCKIANVKVAGKTGTAQNPHGKDHAWFISYAPADDPEIAITVIVENGGGGGLNAVPIGRKIYETYFDLTPFEE